MGELPRLTTPRLVLRPFHSADGAGVEKLAGAGEVADTTLAIPHPYPAGGGARWIATHPGAWERRNGIALAVCEQAAEGRLIGAVSLYFSLAHMHGELGYWIGVPYWGRGFATEAAEALSEFAFSALGLQRVQGRHFTRNRASGRVLEKLGMQLEGVHRSAFFRWGHFEDVAVYAILAAEWTAR